MDFTWMTQWRLNVIKCEVRGTLRMLIGCTKFFGETVFVFMMIVRGHILNFKNKNAKSIDHCNQVFFSPSSSFQFINSPAIIRFQLQHNTEHSSRQCLIVIWRSSFHRETRCLVGRLKMWIIIHYNQVCLNRYAF